MIVILLTCVFVCNCSSSTLTCITAIVALLQYRYVHHLLRWQIDSHDFPQSVQCTALSVSLNLLTFGLDINSIADVQNRTLMGPAQEACGFRSSAWLPHS